MDNTKKTLLVIASLATLLVTLSALLIANGHMQAEAANGYVAKAQLYEQQAKLAVAQKQSFEGMATLAGKLPPVLFNVALAGLGIGAGILLAVGGTRMAFSISRAHEQRAEYNYPTIGSVSVVGNYLASPNSVVARRINSGLGHDNVPPASTGIGVADTDTNADFNDYLERHPEAKSVLDRQLP